MVSKKINKDDLYLHPTIKNLLTEEYFGSKHSFGMKHLDEFTSSHKDHTEPELPIAMVALAATAVSPD
ncbi:hypothetical protein DXG03_006824 [Asterophora parasitica]|uniref:DUF6532 domain-containing protein n=1 Tax=Asterophora parasitica TaxID=117018 RepID=A0A9P7G0S0_9AGAR|nr:hypothetical protein DXG03_006824 [Asterophora parasitica]